MNEPTTNINRSLGTSTGADDSSPRYPLDRLERVTGVFGNDALSRHLGRSPDCVAKLRSRGLSWVQADEVAVAVGLLPYLIWPEWALHEPPVRAGDSDDGEGLEVDLDLDWELTSFTNLEEARS